MTIVSTIQKKKNKIFRTYASKMIMIITVFTFKIKVNNHIGRQKIVILRFKIKTSRKSVYT